MRALTTMGTRVLLSLSLSLSRCSTIKHPARLLDPQNDKVCDMIVMFHSDSLT